ncbi:glycosyltransferase [Candidatus Gottesmanbacteria bacterium]|nr:glycosyltransferase [Candidatus Gottesmanbacteria bacterium]
MKKPTVTIGIPAYNEEGNIKKLLKSLLQQKATNFKLEKILVISDGSTDKTNEIVRSVKSKIIILVVNKKRLGLNGTQNKIFNRINSDIAVLFDADILPKNNDCVEKLISPILNDPQVGLTSGKLYAVRAMDTVIGRILANAHEMKRKISESLPNSNNVYLCAGRMRAFSKYLYKKLKWPDDIPEDAYSYFYCKSRGFRFIYVSKAICYFHPPTILSDHIKQNNRFITGKKALKKYFDNYLLRREYKIPFLVVFIYCLAFLLKRPFSILAYFILMFYISFFKNLRVDHQSRYDIAVSSKRIEIDLIT